MNTNKTIKNLVLAALFAAMTTLLTIFPHIPIGGNGGYIHLGDSIIFLCASLLPTPFAAVSAAIGAGLADFITFPLYTLPTLLIKALLSLPISAKETKVICVRNLAALPFCGLITIGGYYVAEGILYSNWIAPAASIPFNLIQIVGGSAVYVLLGVALDRMKVKRLVQR